MYERITVGTRGSALAMEQTRRVIDRLSCRRPDVEFVVRKITTKGDVMRDVALTKIDGRGVFVKEIERAMLEGEIDLAVHSLKDVPTGLPVGLVIGAVPERADWGAFVRRKGFKLD